MSAFRPDLLSGKAVFIAGGSSGINLGIALACARHGARVAVISRNAERVADAVSELRAQGAEAAGWAADVRDYDAVAATLAQAREAFGPLDIVVSGAAGNFIAPALGLSANAFATIVGIDLLGTFNVFRACFDHLTRPGASLIAVTAPQGATPVMFQAHACAAKAGVNMLTRCLALEWGPAGVRVNAISPGPVAGTEGSARLVKDRQSEVDAVLALRRHATRQEIADAALYLASDASRYVTGTVLDCDGGLGAGNSAGDALTVERRS